MMAERRYNGGGENVILSQLGDLIRHGTTLMSITLPFLAATIAVFVVNSRLPSRYQFQIPEQVPTGYFLTIVITSAFLLVLTCASIWVIRKNSALDKLSEQFRYDQHGTLLNGREPNIAFRIPTFQLLLHDLAKEMQANDAQKAFRDAGSEAAVNFSASIGPIVERTLEDNRGWTDLNFDEKLYGWSKHDSTVGWGRFVAEAMSESEVRVRISHFKGLFSRPGGKEFGHFLSGYCERVLSDIVQLHTKGDVSRYFSARFKGAMLMHPDSVELFYVLTSSKDPVILEASQI